MTFFKIIRPFNCLFVVITVLFGAMFSAQNLVLLPIIAASLSAAFIAAGGYVINDFFDLKIDMINRPERILPAGKMKPKTAYLFAVALFLLGILTSTITQQVSCIAIAFINSLVLFYYAKNLKQSCLIGNLLVAYAAASTFVYGGIANANIKNSLVIASFAFLYTLIREFVKDAEDIEGDEKIGARTLAVLVREKNIIYIAVLPAIVIVSLIQYYFFTNYISAISFVVLNILVSIPLVSFFWMMLKKPEKKSFAKVSSLAKLDMLILLIIIWIGK